MFMPSTFTKVKERLDFKQALEDEISAAFHHFCDEHPEFIMWNNRLGSFRSELQVVKREVDGGLNFSRSLKIEILSSGSIDIHSDWCFEESEKGNSSYHRAIEFDINNSVEDIFVQFISSVVELREGGVSGPFGDFYFHHLIGYSQEIYPNPSH